MAISFHVRSKSVPSIPHTQAAHVDAQLAHLRSSEEASTSSSSSICKRLDNIQYLYESLDKLIDLPVNQKALSQEKNKKAVEQLLDESIRILDLCNTSKDALSQMKEGLNEIHSILRRKRGDLSGEVNKYLTLRNSLNKSFQNVQKSLKVAQIKDNKDGTFVFVIEAETITISLFESLFSYMSGSKTCRKWPVVSKIINKKKVTCEGQANEFTKIDSEIQSEKTLKTEDVQILVSCIQDLEDGLESLSKSLIKYRVSFLNILGH